MRRGLPLVRRTPMSLKNVPITQQRAMLTEVSYGSLFYLDSYPVKPILLTAPFSSDLSIRKKRKEPIMNGKLYFI